MVTTGHSSALWSRAGLVLLGLVLISSCGYRFARGGTLPEGVQQVNVLPFVDRTAEGDLGAQVAASVRSRMREIDPRRVAGLGARGVARLVGSVERVNQSTVPMGRGGYVVPGLYQLSIEARARIESPTGRVLDDLGSFTEGIEYPVETGLATAEESRRRALVRASRALGSRIAEAALFRF
ncbi:MAG: LPS assembly lipoprotein LptE [Pseudomonadota bacterium]